MDTWLTQMCRRSCVRQLLAWGGAAGVLLLMVAANTSYIRGFVGGPRGVSAADLENLRDPDGSAGFFVRVDGSETFDTGVQEVSVKTRYGQEASRSVSSRFYALQVGRRFLFVKTSGGQEHVVAGRLAPIPADFEQQFFAAPENQAHRDQFYPFYLNVSSFRTPGYWAIGLGLAFLALLAWQAPRKWRQLRNLASHPVMARVAAWGDALSISAAVERECGAPDAPRAGGWTLTDRYLVRRSFFGFDVLRFEDLLWAYQRVTRHWYGFIPTGKSHAVLMVCYGGSAELPGREARCGEFLDHAARRAPWAFFGYTRDIAQAFDKRTRDFILAVEERRRQMSTS